MQDRSGREDHSEARDHLRNGFDFEDRVGNQRRCGDRQREYHWGGPPVFEQPGDSGDGDRDVAQQFKGQGPQRAVPHMRPRDAGWCARDTGVEEVQHRIVEHVLDRRGGQQESGGGTALDRHGDRGDDKRDDEQADPQPRKDAKRTSGGVFAKPRL